MLSRFLSSFKTNRREMRMAMDLIIYNKVGRNSWKFLLSDHYYPYDWEAKSGLDIWEKEVD